MATSKPQVLISGIGFAEGPRWHGDRLWYSDMAFDTVMTLDLDGRSETVSVVEHTPSGLGWLPDGTFLVVSMHDHRVLRRDSETGALVTHADVTHLVNAKLNDMVVAENGNAYVSNFGYEAGVDEPAATGIVLVRPDGSSEMLADDLWRPNGLAVTPDGSTLVIAETRVHRLSACTIDDEGRLHDRRVIGDLGKGAWADGICMDAEGAVWVGDPMRSRCVRMLLDGTITDVVETEVPCVAPALGGHDGRTMFLCEAPVRPMADGARDPQGRIEIVRVDVPRGGRP